MTSQRVIVGVDASPGARTALDWAVDECRLRRCTLLVVHSNDPRPAMGEPVLRAGDEVADQLLRECASTASARRPGVPVTTMLSHAPAAETLINLSTDAELVVVGTRGEGGFASTMLGSVSHRTAVHAHAPVAVIPELVSQYASESAPRVVVGAAGGHAGRLAVEFARREAEVRGATLQIVVAGDEPAEVLVRAADGAVVLVVGCHHSDDRWSTRLGPVPSSILHRCPCPVVVVGAVHKSTPLPSADVTTAAADTDQRTPMTSRFMSTEGLGRGDHEPA